MQAIDTIIKDTKEWDGNNEKIKNAFSNCQAWISSTGNKVSFDEFCENKEIILNALKESADNFKLLASYSIEALKGFFKIIDFSTVFPYIIDHAFNKNNNISFKELLDKLAEITNVKAIYMHDIINKYAIDFLNISPRFFLAMVRNSNYSWKKIFKTHYDDMWEIYPDNISRVSNFAFQELIEIINSLEEKDTVVSSFFDIINIIASTYEVFYKDSCFTPFFEEKLRCFLKVINNDDIIEKYFSLYWKIFFIMFEACNRDEDVVNNIRKKLDLNKAAFNNKFSNLLVEKSTKSAEIAYGILNEDAWYAAYINDDDYLQVAKAFMNFTDSKNVIKTGMNSAIAASHYYAYTRKLLANINENSRLFKLLKINKQLAELLIDRAGSLVPFDDSICLNFKLIGAILKEHKIYPEHFNNEIKEKIQIEINKNATLIQRFKEYVELNNDISHEYYNLLSEDTIFFILDKVYQYYIKCTDKKTIEGNLQGIFARIKWLFDKAMKNEPKNAIALYVKYHEAPIVLFANFEEFLNLVQLNNNGAMRDCIANSCDASFLVKILNYADDFSKLIDLSSFFWRVVRNMAWIDNVQYADLVDQGLLDKIIINYDFVEIFISNYMLSMLKEDNMKSCKLILNTYRNQPALYKKLFCTFIEHILCNEPIAVNSHETLLDIFIDNFYDLIKNCSDVIERLLDCNLMKKHLMQVVPSAKLIALYKEIAQISPDYALRVISILALCDMTEGKNYAYVYALRPFYPAEAIRDIILFRAKNVDFLIKFFMTQKIKIMPSACYIDFKNMTEISINFSSFDNKKSNNFVKLLLAEPYKTTETTGDGKGFGDYLSSATFDTLSDSEKAFIVIFRGDIMRKYETLARKIYADLISKNLLLAIVLLEQVSLGPIFYDYKEQDWLSLLSEALYNTSEADIIMYADYFDNLLKRYSSYYYTEMEEAIKLIHSILIDRKLKSNDNNIAAFKNKIIHYIKNDDLLGIFLNILRRDDLRNLFSLNEVAQMLVCTKGRREVNGKVSSFPNKIINISGINEVIFNILKQNHSVYFVSNLSSKEPDPKVAIFRNAVYRSVLTLPQALVIIYKWYNKANDKTDFIAKLDAEFKKHSNPGIRQYLEELAKKDISVIENCQSDFGGLLQNINSRLKDKVDLDYARLEVEVKSLFKSPTKETYGSLLSFKNKNHDFLDEQKKRFKLIMSNYVKNDNHYDFFLDLLANLRNELLDNEFIAEMLTCTKARRKIYAEQAKTRSFPAEVCQIVGINKIIYDVLKSVSPQQMKFKGEPAPVVAIIRNEKYSNLLTITQALDIIKNWYDAYRGKKDEFVADLDYQLSKQFKKNFTDKKQGGLKKYLEQLAAKDSNVDIADYNDLVIQLNKSLTEGNKINLVVAAAVGNASYNRLLSASPNNNNNPNSNISTNVTNSNEQVSKLYNNANL
jgi:hypothetical protein